ncbi:MAG TPA: Ig-like domain-containing protein [Bacteroidota bacterium]|nr:Ig-like domain-containing protein [Bacteroidota bacterium]
MNIHRFASPTITVIFGLVFFLLLALFGCTKEEQGPAGPQGAPGQDGGPDDLTDPNILPAVIFTSPANGSTGPFGLFDRGEGYDRPHFIVRFNKLMATFSVGERTVRCTGFDRPVVVRLDEDYYPPYRFSSGVSLDVFNNFLAFAVYDSVTGYGSMPYHVGRIVTVSIDTTIEDINGHHLVQAYTFSYAPEPYFRVLSIYPEDGSTDVMPGNSPSVMFNSLLGVTIIPSLQLNPQPNGQWRISEFDSMSVSFQPAQPLPFGSQYSLVVANTARDFYGNQVTRSFSSGFGVTEYRVQSSYPDDGATNISLRSSISAEFTGLTDTATIRQAFSIFPATSGILNLQRSGFLFYSTNDFLPGTRYTVTLSTVLTALDGTHLSSPETFSFTTGPFKVDYFYPRYGEYGVSRSRYFTAYCSGGIDTSSVRAAFSITPAASMIFELSSGSSSFSVHPATLLDANRLYTITISTGLRSRNGNPLAAPITTVFTTGQ